MNDQLTGLKNRRSFDQTLRNEWRRSNDSGRPLAVLMLDVDDFKQVNDTFGHQVGDRYLTSIGRALAEVATRPGDVVARSGGEEFIALVPECDSAEAKILPNGFSPPCAPSNWVIPTGSERSPSASASRACGPLLACPGPTSSALRTKRSTKRKLTAKTQASY